VVAGATTLFLRTVAQDEWGEFSRLLVLLIPCVVLYLLGIGVIGNASERFRAVLTVAALLLVPLTLLQFLDLVGGDTRDAYNHAWGLGVTAAMGVYAALRARILYGLLLGALAALLAWLSLWDAILDNPSGTTVRWLLVAAALLLALAAAALGRRGAERAAEVVTGAGVAAVAAGLVGLTAVAFQLVLRALASGGALFSTFGPTSGGVRQRPVWDLFLLVVSLALVLYGARVARRGPAYVGALGLLGFVFSVGLHAAQVAAGEKTTGTLLGWPLLLLLVGAAGLGFALRADRAPR
jgi:hypothetical protein